MIFATILGIVALLLSSIVAYFSVIGFGETFKAVYTPIIVMACGLEISKLVIASYLYREWASIKLAKFIFIPALIALMLVTSYGVYGYLMQGFQNSLADRSTSNLQIAHLETQRDQLKARVADIDAQIAQVPNTHNNSRIRLINQYNADRTEAATTLATTEKELLGLRTNLIASDTHVGPIVEIAKVLDYPIEKAISVLILFLVLILDPVAVALTVAWNKLVIKHRKSIFASPVPIEVVPPEPLFKEPVVEIKPVVSTVNEIVEQPISKPEPLKVRKPRPKKFTELQRMNVSAVLGARKTFKSFGDLQPDTDVAMYSNGNVVPLEKSIVGKIDKPYVVFRYISNEPAVNGEKLIVDFENQTVSK